MTEQITQFFQDKNWLDVALPILQQLGLALCIIIIGLWLASRTASVLDAIMQKRNIDIALRQFVFGIVSAVLKIVVVLMALDQVGFETTTLLALLGAAGLAVGLALKDSLSNFASGIMLILFKPFTIGHYVEAGGESGTVARITVFSTLLTTPDNKEVIVPNSQVYSGSITNYSAKPTRRVDMVFGIGYDDDMKQARQIILDVLSKDDRVLQEPAPTVAVGELADNSVNFLVRPWVKSTDYWLVKWDMLETIKSEFDSNGISTPIPQRDVYVYNADKPKT